MVLEKFILKKKSFIFFFKIILALLLILITIIPQWGKIEETIEKNEIIPENGYCYIYNFRWGKYLKGDSNKSPQSSKLMLFENNKQIGPAHTYHDDIRLLGSGRFSHWGPSLYFSASDNTNPQIKSNTYKIKIPLTLSTKTRIVTGIIAFFLLGLLFIKALKKNEILKNIIFSIIAIIFGFVIALGSIELTARLLIKPCYPVWPVQFDPQFGSKFKPNSLVRWGGVDTFPHEFCVTENVNSMGFVDKEHDIGPAPDRFRILVLGDSFVEAVQVPIGKKFHVLMEAILREKTGLNVESIALGFSGTGTCNQWPY